MSRSSFSKAYEEIANLEPMEMTFTIEDADLDKLHDVLIDINVKECPWFEVQDKHGNKAKYYREPHWIPCSERLPEVNDTYLVCYEDASILMDWFNGHWFFYRTNPAVEETGTINAWMPLPEPWKGEEE